MTMTDSIQWHPTMMISTGNTRQPVSVGRAQPSAGSTPDPDRYQGSLIAAALKAATKVDTVRMDKVAKLKAAIAAGTYKVSAPDLADALITSKALW
jgi:flagellar biosynthesis anti-sigma factor FlgM